jgi:hypothetical protein
MPHDNDRAGRDRDQQKPDSKHVAIVVSMRHAMP